MISRLQAALGRQKHNPGVPDGIDVSALGTLLLEGDAATLAMSSGARHTISMSSGAAGITVTIESLAHPGAPALRVTRDFTLVQAARAQELFASTVASWHRTRRQQTGAAAAAAGRARWPIFLLGAAAGAVALAAVSFASAPGGQRTASGQAPVVAAPAAPAVAPPARLDAMATAAADALRQLQQARLDAKDLQRVASSARIPMRQGAAPLVAFSDPNCPACRDLERESASLKQGVGFTVIPVAFQPGSRDLVARVLCSPNPSRAWAEAVRGTRPQAQACDEGLQKVDANNALFSDIGASATPTLVAGNGQLAQGSAHAAQLEVFATTYAH